MWFTRDGNGGFERNPARLDSFGGAPDDVTNAYIIWSLTYAQISDLDVEVSKLYETSLKSLDSYILGLGQL